MVLQNGKAWRLIGVQNTLTTGMQAWDQSTAQGLSLSNLGTIFFRLSELVVAVRLCTQMGMSRFNIQAHEIQNRQGAQALRFILQQQHKIVYTSCCWHIQFIVKLTCWDITFLIGVIIYMHKIWCIWVNQLALMQSVLWHITGGPILFCCQLDTPLMYRAAIYLENSHSSQCGWNHNEALSLNHSQATMD